MFKNSDISKLATAIIENAESSTSTHLKTLATELGITAKINDLSELALKCNAKYEMFKELQYYPDADIIIRYCKMVDKCYKDTSK
jgi:cytochrome c1